MRDFRTETNGFSITMSEIMEYLYCPRFIYFMNCLDISQHEEQRYKVMKGRHQHELKMVRNKDYLRKKIGCIKKEENVYLVSSKLGIRGIVDEVLFLEDGTASPLDFKFAEYNEKLYNTLKYQSVVYAMLIEENFNVSCRKGYICYIRSKNKLVEVEFTDKIRSQVNEILIEIKNIIIKGIMPKKAKSKMRCMDCCYKNICMQ